MLNCTLILRKNYYSKVQNKPTFGASTFTPKWRAKTLLNLIRSLTSAPIKATAAVMYKTLLSANVLLKSLIN